jgi:hypothetical protein
MTRECKTVMSGIHFILQHTVLLTTSTLNAESTWLIQGITGREETD